jgi:glycosyltransferase involved in cell wall biosynthesis
MLDACLDSLDTQTIGPGEYEVIVVDNGSTDTTPECLRTWETGGPSRRRVLVEPEPGVSRARNRAIDAARGDIVLFLDDDAIAPRGWVEAHLAAYQRVPAAVFVGGPIVLSWPFGRPRWLTPRLEHWFSALDHGDCAHRLNPPHFPYAANMSLRRTHLLEIGGFSPRLGRRGRSLISSPEHPLAKRCWERDWVVYYDPATLVQHRVIGDRTNRRWVLRRGWAQGRSNARVRTETGPVLGRELITVCREELRWAVAGSGGLVRLAARGDGSGVLDEIARRVGHISGALEQLWLATQSYVPRSPTSFD